MAKSRRKKKGKKVWCAVSKGGTVLGCSKSKRSARKIRKARGGKGARVVKRRR